jgi:hypothetical protein
MQFDVDNWKYQHNLKNRLNGIRYGKVADNYGWMYKI